MTPPTNVISSTVGDPTPPAEWARQACVWTAWPHHVDWGDALGEARAEVAALVAFLSRHQPVRVLVRQRDRSAAAAALGDTASLVTANYGDIWLRDTGPVFVGVGEARRARRFAWNGWGGKYVYSGDGAVGDDLAREAGVPIDRCDWVLEGGAIDSNGAGTLLTTRECLLNPNRNPHMTEADVEAALRRDLGARRVVWLDRGLRNDHTDGHVDTLARFVSPTTVACMTPADDDPNRDALAAVEAALGRAGFDVAHVPSPGAVRDDSGELLPASYVNFVIVNGAVAVPTYGVEADSAAVEAVAELFPDREVVGASARAILTGGGAFHCITRDQPA